MNLLPASYTATIAVIVEIAIQSEKRPVQARVIAEIFELPPRYLEGRLQGLVDAGVLRGVRGPRGGYVLGRPAREIAVSEIVRILGELSMADPDSRLARSKLLRKLVEPAVRRAATPFLAALDKLTIEDLLDAARNLA